MIDDAAGVVVAFNGEIYNYIELRKELVSLGHEFRTSSDTEVLLKAYAQWGLQGFARFVGMWAIALFETRTRRLVLSRDRFGIKPLYLMASGDQLAFASTIEALRSIRSTRPSLNSRAVQRFLHDRAVDSESETFFEGITSFPPGCHAIVEAGLDEIKLRYERYWDASSFLGEAGNQVLGFEEARGVFREKLDEAVRLHTRSDVEVASCLSGGLDSSSIVAVLATIPEGASIRKVFSAVFPGKHYDEGRYSAAVANRYDLTHIQIEPTAQTFLTDIDKVIQAQEEPFGSTGVYVQWKIFEEIGKQRIKVAMDGQGADEYLGGYFSFLFPYALDSLMRLQPIRAALALHSYLKGNRTRHYVFWNLSGLLARLFGLRPAIVRSPLSAYLSDSLRAEDYSPSTPEQETAALQGPGFKKTLARYLTKYSLPSLLRYEDKNSMWFSIESRVPFLDHRLVEFALALPSEHLIDGRWTKRILRESVRDIVPAEVIDRKDKIGFGNPEDELVEALIGAGAFRDLLADPIAKDFLNVPQISRLLDERRQRTVDFNFLWRTYNLLTWQQQCLRH